MMKALGVDKRPDDFFIIKSIRSYQLVINTFMRKSSLSIRFSLGR